MGLCLTRKAGETILIGDKIVVKVVCIRAGCVVLDTTAPASVEVDRPEVREKKRPAA